MGYAPRALLAGGLGFAASLLVACGGGSGLLSTDQAATLNGQLHQVSAALDKGQCGAATTALASFNNELDGLSGVNSVATGSLKQGAGTVEQLLRCRTHTTTTTTSSTTASTATSAPAPTVQSTPTVTPTAPTTSAPPPATTPGHPPSGGAGLGNGKGGGPGNSGGAGAGNGGGNGNGNGGGR